MAKKKINKNKTENENENAKKKKAEEKKENHTKCDDVPDYTFHPPHRLGEP